jgi:hypothetical protein
MVNKYALAVMAALLVIVAYAVTNPPEEGGGGLGLGVRVLGISGIDVVGAAAQLYGDEAWLIQTIHGPSGADTLVATRQLVDEDNPEIMSEQRLTIGASLKRQRCTWDIDASSAASYPIYKVNVYKEYHSHCDAFGCAFPSGVPVGEWCESKPNDLNEVIAEEVQLHQYGWDVRHEGTRYCYTYEEVGSLSRVVGGSAETDLEIRIQTDDGENYITETFVGTNQRTSEIKNKFGERVGFVSYNKSPNWLTATSPPHLSHLRFL